MNCLSDSICNAGTVVEWLQTSVSTIDYYGALAFGSEWRAIGPEIAYHVDMISSVIADWFAEPPGGCQRYASLGDFNG